MFAIIVTMMTTVLSLGKKKKKKIKKKHEATNELLFDSVASVVNAPGSSPRSGSLREASSHVYLIFICTNNLLKCSYNVLSPCGLQRPTFEGER